MKMNRSIMCFLLLVVLVLSLCACEQAPVTTGTPTTHTTQPTEGPTATQPATAPTESGHVHSWQEATCTLPKTCAVCGETDGESLDHAWDEGVILKEATEDTAGEMLYTCTTCTETRKETITALGHTHAYDVTEVAPTCTEGGYITHTCRCGDSYMTDQTAALGHDWKAATCTEAKTCARCQETEGSANGHSWTEATCTSAKTCKVCGKTSGSTLAHSYGSWTVVQKPSCTQQGTERRICIRCDAYETREVDATGHSYNIQVTKPTCTEQGYTSYTCTACGDHYKDSYVSALGHDWSDWKILVEPTVESEGRKERNCRVCSAKESTAIDRLPGPIYGTFHEKLNVYEASNQEYYLNFPNYKELHWFAQVTYYTTHTDDQIEIHMIDLFKQAFGYTPNAPVTIENMGKYYVDGVDGVTVYKYAIQDYSVPLVFNEMYTVYEQICTDGVSPWVGFCIYGSGLDDYAMFTRTQEYDELAAQMYQRFEEITGLSMSYMRQHPEQFWIDYISVAGTVRTIDGKVFNALYIYCRSIQVNKHKLKIIEGIWPTADSDGLTQGERCSVCGMITVPQVTIPSYAAVYSDNYYYEQLGKEINGPALQQLYRMLDMAAMQFHFDTSIDLQNDEVAMFSYADLGLSTEDAVQVWVYYKNDHPLYYWISAWVGYSDSELFLLTESDYTQGDVRAAYNDLIVKKVEEYLDIVSGKTSDYRIALAFHDLIIKSIDYAYESDGVTPEDELWAHRVLGVFDERGVVCEGYAQAYQLLLNAAGVENIFVVGNAGVPGSGFGAHAWNLVQLDDGNWYWCDLTWDDSLETQTGIIYNYFCVNDTQNVNLYNGVSMSVKYSFTDSHEVCIEFGRDYEWTILLPDRSESVFVK